MRIDEVMGWYMEYSKMDRVIDDTLRFLQSKDIDDGNIVKKTLLMVGKRMGVNNIKRLFNRFHERIARDEIPSRYSFYSDVSLRKDDSRFAGVMEAQLLEYFQVPQKVLEPIKRHYIHSVKKAQAENIKRVTSSTLPIKKFELDFSGTKYAFLNDIDTTMSVKFNATRNKAYYSPRTRTIVLPLLADSPEETYYSTIEHELLHLIQHLISNYRRKKDKFHDGSWGGMANKKVMRDIGSGLDMHGYTSDGGYRRTTHAKRPVEHLPNLNTVLRKMELGYEQKIKGLPNYKKMQSNKKEKKEFMLRYIEDDIFISNILDTVKRQSTELYKAYIKTLYKGFVNGIPLEDISDIESKLSPDEDKSVADAPVGEVEIIDNVSEKFKNNKISLDLYDAADWSELEDGGNIDFIEELVDIGKGITSRENTYGDLIFRVPLSPNKLKKILKRWKHLGERHSRDEEELKNYEIVSKNMLKFMLRELEYKISDKEHVEIVKKHLLRYLGELWK